MILTVCPNPCIDYTIEVETLNIGRLTRIENKIENYAGKACNTAIGIARLGREVTASGFLFEKGAKAFLNYLEKENVRCNFIVNKGTLRTNIKIIDSKSMLTELNDSGGEVVESKQNDLLKLMHDLGGGVSVTVISGSLPKGVSPQFYGKMVSAASGKVIVDCEKDNLKAAVSNGVYLVKPNLSELENYNKENYKTNAEMLKGCYRLLSDGAQKVLLSLGRRGAILTDGTVNYYCRSENVAVNSTVGAGDSMVAAASCCIERGDDDEELLRSAVAAGTASITTPGTNLFTYAKYLEIYNKLKVTKIKL